jgi:hypothetical protein
MAIIFNRHTFAAGKLKNKFSKTKRDLKTKDILYNYKFKKNYKNEKKLLISAIHCCVYVLFMQ